MLTALRFLGLLTLSLALLPLVGCGGNRQPQTGSPLAGQWQVDLTQPDETEQLVVPMSLAVQNETISGQIGEVPITAGGIEGGQLELTSAGLLGADGPLFWFAVLAEEGRLEGYVRDADGDARPFVAVKTER